MDVIVVGAGVAGLACAWRAADAGHAVAVVDPAPGRGASWVAGGMLAPVTEAWPGEEELLGLGLESVAHWPGFAAALAAAAGLPAGLRTEGTLVAGTGAGDRAELDALADFLSTLGRDVERLTGRELRRREPALGPDVRAGLAVPGDLAVDNRLLLAALRAACVRAGVELVEQAVAAVTDDGERVTGVRLAAVHDGGAGIADGRLAAVHDGGAGIADGRPAAVTDDGTRWRPGADGPGGAPDLRAEAVVVAAGAWSAHLHPALDGLVRPVKGEILRLQHRPGALRPPSRTVRALVDGRPVYAVPRDDGGLVLGATQYEAGYDTAVTVAGVRDLLRDAERVLPSVAEYALVETAAGLRPGTPDNRPLIGPLGPSGLIAATGHGRNGILLAPVTADAVTTVLDGGRAPAAADPLRFAKEVARAGVDQR